MDVLTAVNITTAAGAEVLPFLKTVIAEKLMLNTKMGNWKFSFQNWKWKNPKKWKVSLWTNRMCP